jgi:hypothetical protein
MVLDLRNEAIVTLLDSQFRDYPILANRIRYSVAERKVIVPFLAPNWTIPTPHFEIFTSMPEPILWLMDVHFVDNCSIVYSEQTDITEFELASICLIPPCSILIRAHSILTIKIECSQLDVRLKKVHLIEDNQEAGSEGDCRC